MLTQIKFGTSGWRAVMAEDFTFANVRRALHGIARHVSGKSNDARVIVGRDPRFLGETFCEMAGDILGQHGVTAVIIAEPTPTPAIAYAVIKMKADGAINFTASHNPAEYNGIKFSTPDGAPALPETTKAIEAEIAAFDAAAGGTPPKAQAKKESLDPKKMYLDRLRELVDLDVVRKAGLKVSFDPFWGAARGYSDSLLHDAGVSVTTVHDHRDVLFGGHAPEPDDHLLGDLRQSMREFGAQIGIATDGDADRFGVVDGDGAFIQPNYIIALLFDYLVETRGWKNGVCKSVATTNLVNALAQKHKVELFETPVGFKYIGELIKNDKILIGGEESAGLSIRGHVPEKDGVLAGLLCCEMVARRGASLSKQLQKIFDQVGSYYPLRQNFRLTAEVQGKFTEKLRRDPADFDGSKVAEVVRKDGLKLVLADGSWVCYRLSGTEPVVRVYTEARSKEGLEKLSAAAKAWIFD
jgi:phosphoglucomutase